MTPFAILCPGQGAQTTTMFDPLVDDPAARAVLDAFSDAASIDLVARTAAVDRLDANVYAQPAIVASAVATWTVLRAHLPTPSVFAGYSVGEVSAWACAGAWNVAEAASVTMRRVEAMDRYGPTGCGMLAVRGMSRDEIEDRTAGLFVAIVNAADHVVLAGPEATLDAASDALLVRGAWTRRLDVRVPSHTPLMHEAAQRFAEAAKGTPARDVASRVLRGVDGEPCRSGVDAMTALSRAIEEPIRWDACLRALTEAGIGVALELGPGRALAEMCTAQCPGIVVRSIADFRSLGGVTDWLLQRLD